MTGSLVKGWCPGALRPMRGGDGLIVRLRITGGTVATGLAGQIADWSCRWGNGRIELTSRANLQLRGISERHLADLHDSMTQWNLLDASAAGEAVRNVIASPLSGLDPTALLDIRPIVRALEQRLAGDTRVHDLPAKFGFAIDDGGTLGLADVVTDIRFEARHGSDGPEFAVGLGGMPAGRRCRPDELVDTAVALCLSFLSLRRGHEGRIGRIHDLVAARGVAAIWGDCPASDATAPRITRPAQASSPIVILGLDPRSTSGTRRAIEGATTDTRAEPTHDGRNAGRDNGAAVFVGAGLPFGTIAAEDFAVLTSEAAAAGARELRLTPWRVILVPVPSVEAGRDIVAGLAAHPFILDRDDPRRRVAACSGAPSCMHATTAVRHDAARLAATLTEVSGPGIVLHVSGCEKGCAHPKPAAITLVGRDGRYDLVAGGLPSSPPILRGLRPDQLTGHVVRIARGSPA